MSSLEFKPYLTISELPDHWVSEKVLLTVVLVVAGLTYTYATQGSRAAEMPFVGLELGSITARKRKYLQDASTLLTEGYRRFRNGIFQVTTTEGTRIIAGQKFYPDLVDFKDDELSFKGSIADLFATHYTGVLISDDLKELSINRDLTPGLARLTAKLELEIDHAIAQEIGPCDDWTAVHMCKATQNMIASATARCFVGPELCRNQDWLRISVDYWMDAFAAAKAIKFWPVWLRPLAARLMPQPARMRATREEAQALVVPVLKRRLDAMKKNKNDNSHHNNNNKEKPDDMMQWMMDRLGDQAGTVDNLQHQAHLQLALAMGAIHSTNFTLLHEMFDLAAYTHLHEPLRQEFNEAMAKSNPPGVLTKAVLNQLVMLDSFMKESQRYNPPGLTNGRRKTLKDLTLHDGTVLPAGSNIELPANNVNRDDSIYPDPDTYDAFRFYKLRQQAASQEDGTKYMFVASNKNSLNWGMGRHACPGRFFAADETKIILSKVLQTYDMKLVDGESKRYANTSFETMVIPDMEKAVLFKRRRSPVT